VITMPPFFAAGLPVRITHITQTKEDSKYIY
jgi:hypothetical protein